MKLTGNEPAYPTKLDYRSDEYALGIPLRLHIAAQVLAGMCSSSETLERCQNPIKLEAVVGVSLDMADLLISQHNKTAGAGE